MASLNNTDISNAVDKSAYANSCDTPSSDATPTIIERAKEEMGNNSLTGGTGVPMVNSDALSPIAFQCYKTDDSTWTCNHPQVLLPTGKCIEATGGISEGLNYCEVLKTKDEDTSGKETYTYRAYLTTKPQDNEDTVALVPIAEISERTGANQIHLGTLVVPGNDSKPTGEYKYIAGDDTNIVFDYPTKTDSDETEATYTEVPVHVYYI